MRSLPVDPYLSDELCGPPAEGPGSAHHVSGHGEHRECVVSPTPNPPRKHRLGDMADRPAPVMREDDASLIALVREAPEELGDRFGAVWAEGRELALDEAKTLARVADRHGLK